MGVRRSAKLADPCLELNSIFSSFFCSMVLTSWCAIVLKGG